MSPCVIPPSKYLLSVSVSNNQQYSTTMAEDMNARMMQVRLQMLRSQMQQPPASGMGQQSQSQFDPKGFAEWGNVCKGVAVITPPSRNQTQLPLNFL